MEHWNTLLHNKGQLILTILFVIFLITGLKMPSEIANVIDTNVGKILIALGALSLFAYTNPILAVLGVVVSYQLINSAAETTGTKAMDQYFPISKKQWGAFTPTNQFPYTLEQEMVQKMTPTKFNTDYVKPPYKPVLENNGDAAPVNYNGAI